MAVDMSQPVPTQPAPPDALAALGALVGPQLSSIAAPLVAQATEAIRTDVAGVQNDIAGLQNAADSHGGLIGVLQGVADQHSSQIAALESQLRTAGTAVLGNLESDTTTQRYLVWGVAGAVLIGSLVVLVCALLGNQTANHWLGAAPAAVVAVALWLSKAGDLTGPAKKPAP